MTKSSPIETSIASQSWPIIAQYFILLNIVAKHIKFFFRFFTEPENVSNSSDQREHSGRNHVRSSLLRKAKRKALRMSLFIVIAFFICWLPYYVVFTGFAFGHWTSLDPSVMSGLTFVGLTNSILNPIIYGAFQLCKVPNNPRLVWRAIVSKPSSNEFMYILPMEVKKGNMTRLRIRSSSDHFCLQTSSSWN